MEILDIPELAPVVPEIESDNLQPRSPAPNCLPDGTPLRLTAGIVVDLATLFAEEFAAYYPQRTDEFAFMLYMASHEPREWREGKPSLMGDFTAFRNTVMDWIDTAFRPSEATMIPFIGLNLWLTANGRKVTVVDDEQKKTSAAGSESLTTPTN